MESSENEKFHSKWIMGSYGMGAAINQFFRMAFITFGFYFYEAEIGLNVWLTGLGYVIFAVWNAVNDPLIGYLTNRPFKFTKKWGRRFPWVLIGGIPWIFTYFLVFIPPNVDPQGGAWILFAWLVVTTCLFDTFTSIWWVNWYALFPDKFRSAKERRTASGVITPVGIIGITLGGIIPPLFITYGVPSSFIIQAGVVSIIGFLMLMIGIPGARDDPESVERYLQSFGEDKAPKESFFKRMFISLHQKSFLAFLLIYVSFQVLTFSVQASIPYLVRFVLKKEARDQLLLQIGFLIGALIAIPFWIKFAHKNNNNRRVYIIAAFFLAFASIPLTFIVDYYIIFVLFIIWGAGLGGFWALNRIILSDAVDEAVLETKKREEGIYTGIMMFFNRLGLLIQVIIFVIVHSLTGFVEGAATQSDSALWGIRLHLGLIPMTVLLIGTLIFWKMYDLTPSRMDDIEYKIKELKI